MSCIKFSIPSTDLSACDCNSKLCLQIIPVIIDFCMARIWFLICWQNRYVNISGFFFYKSVDYNKRDSNFSRVFLYVTFRCVFLFHFWCVTCFVSLTKLHSYIQYVVSKITPIYMYCIYSHFERIVHGRSQNRYLIWRAYVPQYTVALFANTSYFPFFKSIF